MNFYLYLLLITLFCSHDCKLDSTKEKISNDITDFDMRMKGYHNELNGNRINNGMNDKHNDEIHNDVHNEVHHDAHNEIRDNKHDAVHDDGAQNAIHVGGHDGAKDGAQDRAHDGGDNAAVHRAQDGGQYGTHDQALKGALNGALKETLNGAQDGAQYRTHDGAHDGDGELNGEHGGAQYETHDGTHDGAQYGTYDGAHDGGLNGAHDGTIDGGLDGAHDGGLDGVLDGALGKENENSAYPDVLENDIHKTTGDAGEQQKIRDRRNKKTKFYKRLKVEDEGSRRGCECKEPQNALHYDDQDSQRSQLEDDSDENAQSLQSEEGLNILNRFPYKRGSAARRRLLKKLLGVSSMAENNTASNNNNNNNNDNNNKYVDDYTFDDNGSSDLSTDDHSNEISELRPAGYVLLPKQNKLIVLKSPNTNAANEGMATLRNVQFNDVTNNLNEPVRALKGNVSSLNGGMEMDSACTGGKRPNDASMANNDDFKMKLKAEIINCTSQALDKHLNLKSDASSSGEKSAQNGLSVSDKESPFAQSKNDLMNLNITINGVVMKDDKPREIRGNGTVKVRRPNDDGRERRFIKFPFSKKTSKKQKKSNTADDEPQCSKSDSKDLENERESKACPHKSTSDCATAGRPDTGLTPDRLSNEIIKMVSQMVRSNPHMKTLWPSLQTNKPFKKSEANSLRTTANTSSRKQVEDMVRKAMESVNEIIEKEIQSRSCVPLTKDLADFYEVILEMHAKQAKRKEQREQVLVKSENFDKEKLEESGSSARSGQCKTDSDKDDNDADLQDNAIYDVMHLKRLELDREMAEARQRRNSEKHLQTLATDISNSSLARKLRQMYSPAFLKLNSKMESLKESENVPQ